MEMGIQCEERACGRGLGVRTAIDGQAPLVVAGDLGSGDSMGVENKCVWRQGLWRSQGTSSWEPHAIHIWSEYIFNTVRIRL